MKIKGIGTISKRKAMEILTREGRDAVGEMYKLEQVKKACRIGNNTETFRACYKWIPDDMKEDLTPDQLGRLTDQFYECYGGKCVNE